MNFFFSFIKNSFVSLAQRYSEPRCFASVSYTHLDVYKRQVQYSDPNLKYLFSTINYLYLLPVECYAGIISNLQPNRILLDWCHTSNDAFGFCKFFYSVFFSYRLCDVLWHLLLSSQPNKVFHMTLFTSIITLKNMPRCQQEME